MTLPYRSPFVIPGAPKELLDVINARRAVIPAGMTMMADPAEEATPEGAPALPAPPSPSTPSPALEPRDNGEDWKARAEAAQADAEKWKQLARKHERRQLEALGFDPDTAEKVLTERRQNPKVVADKVAGYDELLGRIAGLEEREKTATARADVAMAVAEHGVSREDAALLDGLSGDALTNLAKRLGKDNTTTTPPAAGTTAGQGNVGDPVSGPKQIATREEYAALTKDERRKARQDGRLNQLLGVSE